MGVKEFLFQEVTGVICNVIFIGILISYIENMIDWKSLFLGEHKDVLSRS